MATFIETANFNRKQVAWMAMAGGAVLLMVMVTTVPMYHQSLSSANEAVQEQKLQNYLASTRPQAATVERAKVATYVAPAAAAQPQEGVDVTTDRKIVRTGALELVVQRPAEAAERIAAIAAKLGGYVVNQEGGGHGATSASLTICVPAARFEEARAELRKLAVRVDSEKVEAQDVTRQYVDQDASLRNLHAEEAQYLTIMKQAHTVKDMLAVSEKISEVRGQIEQEQAEFNALSKQIETASIAISLRTEAEAQVFGLNWRPGYQLKQALHDGLESVANYATAMTGILFYLPAIVLWLGTILLAVVGGLRVVTWAGRRWFGLGRTAASAVPTA